jgi:hypothetical protein
MQRREFLSLAAAAAAVNWSAASSLAAASDLPADASTLEQQRRLVHREECRRRIRKCLRERTVINYRPGQVVYNLGEYPCRKPWDPDEWDDQQLEQYSRAGIEVVQVHEEWSDSQRLFGADKLSALNEKGFLRFVDMCHRHRLKIIPYISTGYFERNDPDQQREALKDHPPYLVPCIDVARTSIAHEDDLYLHSIPYLQFPVLMAGRPVTGERAVIPGIQYSPEPKNPDVWTRSRHMKRIWDFYQKHPDDPYSYGWWDSCPGRPEARPTYYRWLKLYRAMTEPGTHAFVEVTQSDLIAEPLPDDVRMSVFANRELYFALANYSTREACVTTADPCTLCSRDEPAPTRTWRLQPRSLVVVKRNG